MPENGVADALTRGLGFEVLLEWAVHRRHIVIGVCPRHRWTHVPDEHGLRPSLRLYALAWVIDNIRIDVGYAVEYYGREAFPGKSDAPPGEPFQGPMGAHVDDDVRTEVVP